MTQNNEECDIAVPRLCFPAWRFKSSTIFEEPMRNKLALKSSRFTVVAVTVFASLLLGSSAMAQSDDPKTCSNKTLSGDYGMLIEGTILGPDLPLRTVAMAHFDGDGNMAGVSHVVLNGAPPVEEWKPDTATYTVNSNCSGVVTFNTPPGSPPLVVHFVLVKHGTEILGVVDGAAITMRAQKVN